MHMMNRRILLADDDADDRELFQEIFGMIDGEALLHMVENGMEVIQLLDSMPPGSDIPDLIILDQNMPKMNGKQTLQWLKTSDRYAHIPVIIFSTYSDDRLIRECSQLGASLVITKPSSFDEYQKMVNDFFLEIKN